MTDWHSDIRGRDWVPLRPQWPAIKLLTMNVVLWILIVEAVHWAFF